MSLLDRVFGSKKDDHYSKGMEHYTAGRYREAIDEFERVISSTQDRGNPYYNLGVFYAARARANIGLVHYRKGEYEDALAELSRAVEVNSDYPDLHYYIGVVYENLGRCDEAVRELKTAVEINPEYVEARCHLAICLHEVGDTDGARTHLEKAIDSGLEIGNLSSLPASGKYHIMTVEPMLDSLKKMLKERRTAQDHIDLGVEAYNRGDVRNAMVEFETARDAKPAWADVRV